MKPDANVLRHIFSGIRGSLPDSRSPMLRNVATLSAGSLLSQLIGIGASLVLARIYTPDDFGVYGIFTSWLGILTVVATGRYEYAIMRPRRDTDAYALASLIVAVSACGALLIPAVYAGARSLGLLGDIPAALVVLLAVALPLNGLTQSLTSIANRSERYRLMATSSIAGNTVRAVIAISLGLIGTGIRGMIYGLLAGSTAAAATLCRPPHMIRLWLKSVSWRNILRQARRYWRFPAYELPGTLFNTLSTKLPPILLALTFTTGDIGLFTVAMTFTFLPISLITDAQNRTFYKSACSADAATTARLAKETLSFNLISGTLIAAVISLWAADIFSLLLGERWRTAGDYATCLVPLLFSRILFSPLSCIFLAKDRLNTALLYNALTLLTRTAAIVAGMAISGPMAWPVLLYSLAGAGTYIVSGIHSLRLCGLTFSNKAILSALTPCALLSILWILRMYAIYG